MLGTILWAIVIILVVLWLLGWLAFQGSAHPNLNSVREGLNR